MEQAASAFAASGSFDPQPEAGSAFTMRSRATDKAALSIIANPSSEAALSVRSTSSGERSRAIVATVIDGAAIEALGVGGATGVRGVNNSPRGRVFGVQGEVASPSGAGITGGNLSREGGVGVHAFTAAPSGRAIVAQGSVYINNNTTEGSATGARDILTAKSEAGGLSGIDSQGRLFASADQERIGFARRTDTRGVLERVKALPVYDWSFKGGENRPNIGPVAQDFNTLFPSGSDRTVITQSVMDGVLVGAVQELSAELDRTRGRLECLEQDHETQRNWLGGACAAAASMSVLTFMPMRGWRRSLRQGRPGPH